MSVRQNFFIVDSGGTKTEWSYINGGSEYATYITKGLSPQVLTTEEMIEIIREELLPKLDKKATNPNSIYFYGAGCSIQSNILIVSNAIKSFFPKATVEVQHDMLGAARSLCLDKKGVVAILGTGSSSAVYEGKWISKSRTGIGYVLGDEGSGAYMGKKLLNLYCFNELGATLATDLEVSFHINRDSVLENVYKKEVPNKYLASFARFISNHKKDPQMHKLILDSLEAFFVRHLLKFEEAKTMTLNFNGGVANIFADELELVAKKYNVRLGKIMRSPMKGLIEYHLNYD